MWRYNGTLAGRPPTQRTEWSSSRGATPDAGEAGEGDSGRLSAADCSASWRVRRSLSCWANSKARSKAWIFSVCCWLTRANSTRLRKSGAAVSSVCKSSCKATTKDWRAISCARSCITCTCCSPSARACSSARRVQRCCANANSRVSVVFSSSSASNRSTSTRRATPTWCCIMCTSASTWFSRSNVQRAWVNVAHKAPPSSSSACSFHQAASASVVLHKAAWRSGRTKRKSSSRCTALDRGERCLHSVMTPQCSA